MKPTVIFLLFLKILYSNQPSSTIPASTYSIVAYDPETGQLGVAVQSHWFSVGFLVPWAKAGVGAVATQSFVKVEYGPDGINLMEEGFTAKEALKKLLLEDKAKEVRQVSMIDTKGNVATHTGSKCIYAAGHFIGNNYSVQANMMEKESVWDAMSYAYENTKGDLADRLMAALESAEKEGGDIRGKQSAAMLIVSGEPTGFSWKDIEMDLRVDDHPEPLNELKRLIRISRAYHHANKGDYFLELNQINNALEQYDLASSYYPENPELPYWSAVALVKTGRFNKAIPIFRNVFRKEPRLRILIPRLAKAGLLPDDTDVITKIMNIK